MIQPTVILPPLIVSIVTVSQCDSFFFFGDVGMFDRTRWRGEMNESAFHYESNKAFRGAFSDYTFLVE